jgi:Tol biopolymer transport system component
MRFWRSPVVSCLTVVVTLVLACSEPTGPEPLGTIEVLILPSGQDIITAGLQVSMVNGPTRQLDSGQVRTTFPGLPVATYGLRLDGLSSNCQVTSSNPRQVAVVANQVTVVTFTIVCTRRVGSLRVVTITTGPDADPDGYMVAVDGGSHPLAVNGTATLAGIGEGSRLVTLSGVTPNCVVADGPTRTAFVQLGGMAEVVFSVGCVAFATVEATVTTTGVSIDPDGFAVNLQSASLGFSESVAVDANDAVVFDRLHPADDYHLTLVGINANCSVTGGAIRAFTLDAGATARPTFAVVCETPRHVAFEREGDVYVMATDGTGLRRLTTDPSFDGDASWSSTGKIAFTSLRNAQDAELYVMNDDGSNATRLTTSAGVDNTPSWSPDGQKIVFRSGRDVNSEIYVVNADGTGLVRLTNNDANDREPAWSTTGKIAFVSDRDHPSGEIYVMNVDGSNVVRLTHNDSVEASPAWSPDGSMIAFSREVDCSYSCTYDVFVMNADGSGQGRLATGWQTYQYNSDPAWSPNGRSVSFTRQYCGYYYYCDPPSVWVVDVQGGQLVQVVTEAANAAWKP